MPTGRLRPSGYLRYAQDMAWRHSESAGFGRDWYAERSLTWLVRNVSLHLVAAVTYGEQITLTTEDHRLAPRLGATPGGHATWRTPG